LTVKCFASTQPHARTCWRLTSTKGLPTPALEPKMSATLAFLAPRRLGLRAGGRIPGLGLATICGLVGSHCNS
jgi:hypothetical protein